MPDLWTDLLGCLDLRNAADDSSFDGVSQQLQYHRVFGGQLLAQFVRAATPTCPDKVVKSLHTVFVREGRAAEPVRYHATRQHQGRSFASVTITARQPHAVLASSSVSMHAVEYGPKSQDCEPVSAVLDENHRIDLDLIPWESTRRRRLLRFRDAGEKRSAYRTRSTNAENPILTKAEC